MAIQRFLGDIDRTRRGAGALFGTFGLVVLSLVVWASATFARVTGTTVTFFLVGAGLLAIGLRLILHRTGVFEIDAEARTYAVLQKGQRWAGPLADLAPLEVAKRTRVVGTGSKRRTVEEYVVRAAEHSDIDLYCEDSPGRARQRLERLGKAWRLACKSYGGGVREAEELDQPLHERLRGEVRPPTPLRPEWQVRVEKFEDGYAIVSSRRVYWLLVQPVMLLGLLLAFAYAGHSGSWVSFHEFRAAIGPQGDMLSNVLLGLLGVVVLVVLWNVGQGALDALLPGRLRVTSGGVSYRLRRMRFAKLEEVVGSAHIELVGDRRVIALPMSFCPGEAVEPVAREIERLVVEVGSRSQRL